MSKEYEIGQAVKYRGLDYRVVGLSTMVYDKDCEGEPEWKITRTIQEVAIATDIQTDREYHFEKPCWLSVTELENHPNAEAVA